MTCCDKPENQRLYAAETHSGQAIYCKKCGGAHPATRQEIDRVATTKGSK